MDQDAINQLQQSIEAFKRGDQDAVQELSRALDALGLASSGDNIDIGTISNAGGVAIGHNARVIVQQGMLPAELEARFIALINQLERRAGPDQDPGKPFDPALEPETVLVPAGPFLMGSPRAEDVPEAETPEHEVNLADFCIGRFPVTNALYERFIRANKTIEAPDNWFNRKPPGGEEAYPVCGVSWFDAMAYCSWLSAEVGRPYRLPSEAEWEKAAAWSPQGVKRRYPWGDDWLDGACNCAGSSRSTASDHQQGASAYGVLDLLGNVQEWTRSMWGSDVRVPQFKYPYQPQEDGRELLRAQDMTSGMRAVHRGGSYRSSAKSLRLTQRGHAAPNSRVSWRGFRVLLNTGRCPVAD